MNEDDMIIDISSPLILNPQNIQDDGIKKTQENLIMMGFDIEMVNKIISTFKIRTEAEALDYLLKNENGMWENPFIPKVEEEEDKKSIKAFQDKDNNKNNKIKLNEDICEICGESKDVHLIKEFNSNNNNNINNNFNFINYDEGDINTNNNNIFTGEDIVYQEEEEINDINQKECEICMSDLENPITIMPCKHQFCQDCFHSYLINLIKNNQIDKIPCPKNKCKNKNISENFFSKYLSDKEYFKYCDFKAKNEIARDATKIFCPLCNSYADIDKDLVDLLDSNNPNYIKSTLKCKKGHEFCSCGRPLHEGNCYKDEKEFKNFIENEKIKRCPKCGFLIKKNKGCNHMTCGNPTCKYEFCWLCMKETKPGHYENTPCAGKQFLDTESFEYQLAINHPCLHRVITVFLFILGILMVLLFITIPSTFISLFCFFMIFVEPDPDLGIDKLKPSIKFILFLSDIFIAIGIGTVGYMVIGIGLTIIVIVGIIIIILAIFDILKLLMELLCYCCLDYENEYFHCTKKFTSWVGDTLDNIFG